MSKKFLFTLYIMAMSFSVFAQNKVQSPGKVHKIVFQLSSADTLVHSGLMKQLRNVLAAAPDSKIEVVCHGPGINMLLSEKTLVRERIQHFTTNGVTFKACENTLKERNISKDKIIAEAGFVPSALIEIVLLQEDGWSYIKSGF